MLFRIFIVAFMIPMTSFQCSFAIGKESQVQFPLSPAETAKLSKMAAPNFTRELVHLTWHIAVCSPACDPSKIADFHWKIQQLQQNAAERIPLDATEMQRAKLQHAAMVDIRRAIREVRNCRRERLLIPTVRNTYCDRDFEIFGEGSLFDRLLRQEELCTN